MVKKAKRVHFQNIILSEITDNKKFWKAEAHILVTKLKTIRNIFLIEKSALVPSDVEITKAQNECYIRKIGNIENPVKKASFKYQYYPSITNIKDIMKSTNISSFSFQPVSIDKECQRYN